jgi:cyclophilin family peptidyl-prolyl cis-trans isomerase
MHQSAITIKNYRIKPAFWKIYLTYTCHDGSRVSVSSENDKSLSLKKIFQKNFECLVFRRRLRTVACQAFAQCLMLPAMKFYFSILAVVCSVLFGACKSQKEDAHKETITTELEEVKSEPVAPAKEGSKVRFKTNLGEILIELNAEKAPITVANFLKYAAEKHYDGTVFHRVIDGFMIQGGGFALEGTKLVEKKTGAGIQNESQNGLSNDKGTIAMARTNNPNSATAQFFINVADNSSLNYPNHNGYTVFGKVIEGMDLVEKIKSVETTSKNLTMLHPHTGQPLEQPAGDVPTESIIIESAMIE